MENFSIQIECKGYGFHIELDPENIITKQPNYLYLKFSEEELDQIINKLKELKIIMAYNEHKWRNNE